MHKDSALKSLSHNIIRASRVSSSYQVVRIKKRALGARLRIYSIIMLKPKRSMGRPDRTPKQIPAKTLTPDPVFLTILPTRADR